MTKALRLCFLCCGIAAALSSCHDSDDSLFTQPASQRQQAVLDHARQVLRSSAYGWELEYYPGADLDYGGIVYTVKFDSLHATVACSLIADSTATSLYRLTNDNGPVLTFDTYNPLLHYYATPSSNEYEAKGGDFEFVIDSIANDCITLYGKKSRNRMTLRRLTNTADDYARQAIDIFDHFVDSLQGDIGTQHIKAKCRPADKRIIMDSMEMAYAYTNHGIRLYQPLTMGGVSVQSFAFDKETCLLTCTDAGCENIVLQGIPYNDQTMSYAKYEGDYNMIYQGGSVAVHLTPNRLEGTYLLQGLSSHYDLTLRYDSATGNLTLGSQMVGETGGRPVYWVCYDPDKGSLSLTDDGQFTISWNKNRFYPMFNFAPTNPRLLNCTGALLITLYTDEGGTVMASLVDDAEWMTNGSMQFLNLKSLNRKTRL